MHPTHFTRQITLETRVRYVGSLMEEEQRWNVIPTDLLLGGLVIC